MPARLGVNVDHVATLRQARRAAYPDPVAAAQLAELAGADQITIHLREDRRHIQDRDLQVLRRTVTTRLNLEMAVAQEMLRIAYEVKPDMVTLVPERREELTTEGGLDAVGGREAVRKAVKTLGDAEIEVSLFIDPDLDQVKAAHRAEAQAVELHTGRYCDAAPDDVAREIAALEEAAQRAAALGLVVNAGHGLTVGNVAPVARLPRLHELNIGHSIVARAVLIGMEAAVREMRQAIDAAVAAPSSG